MTESEDACKGFWNGKNAEELGIFDEFERGMFEMLSPKDFTDEEVRSEFNSFKEKKENPLETQVGGTHYKRMKIQPLEFVIANGLDAFQKDILKYITRDKENRLQDLRKAAHYLNIYISVIEANPNWPGEKE